MVDLDKNPNLSIIVAVAQNQVIGKDNMLLWHLSDDLKRFKSLTSGHSVVMGRNTWRSLPRRPLPKRRNIVLTHDLDFHEEGAEAVHSLPKLMECIKDEEEAFCIGGSMLYRQLMPYAQRLYVTWVFQDFEGDALFPIIDESVFYRSEESQIQTDEATGLRYQYVCYERRPKSRRPCV